MVRAVGTNNPQQHCPPGPNCNSADSVCRFEVEPDGGGGGQRKGILRPSAMMKQAQPFWPCHLVGQERHEKQRANKLPLVKEQEAKAHLAMATNVPMTMSDTAATNSVIKPCTVEVQIEVWLKTRKAEYPAMNWTLDTVRALVESLKLPLEDVLDWSLDGLKVLARDSGLTLDAVFDSRSVVQAVRHKYPKDVVWIRPNVGAARPIPSATTEPQTQAERRPSSHMPSKDNTPADLAKAVEGTTSIPNPTDKDKDMLTLDKSQQAFCNAYRPTCASSRLLVVAKRCRCFTAARLLLSARRSRGHVS